MNRIRRAGAVAAFVFIVAGACGQAPTDDEAVADAADLTELQNALVKSEANELGGEAAGNVAELAETHALEVIAGLADDGALDAKTARTVLETMVRDGDLVDFEHELNLALIAKLRDGPTVSFDEVAAELVRRVRTISVPVRMWSDLRAELVDDEGLRKHAGGGNETAVGAGIVLALYDQARASESSSADAEATLLELETGAVLQVTLAEAAGQRRLDTATINAISDMDDPSKPRVADLVDAAVKEYRASI